jgi:hypothetical protein
MVALQRAELSIPGGTSSSTSAVLKVKAFQVWHLKGIRYLFKGAEFG